MNFDGNFKELTTINIDDLVSRVERITLKEWVKDTSRQEAFPDVATDVKTIMLKFNGYMNDGGFPSDTITYKDWDEWEDVIQPVLNQVYSLFKRPFLNKCMIVNLKSKGEIPPHNDMTYSFAKSHRLHIPLITNKDCIMTVGDDSKNMKKSVLYEVNNRRLHSVKNSGCCDRIHLLFDIYEKDL